MCDVQIYESAIIVPMKFIGMFPRVFKNIGNVAWARLFPPKVVQLESVVCLDLHSSEPHAVHERM